MALGLLVGLLATLGSSCEGMSAPPGTQWLADTAEVRPVAPANQQQALESLGPRVSRSIDEGAAEALVGSGAPENRFYYLVRTGVVGPASSTANLSSTAFSVGFDTNHTAYVQSFRLSRSRETADVAVVVFSEFLIDRFVATCSAAE